MGFDGPNIIFIMADDLGYGDLGCYGQKLIATPHIDGMAAEGMRFTDFYSGSTVCAPARSCLMTGQHTGHTRVRGNFSLRKKRVPLQPADVTVAEVLKKAGYVTGIIGKWGLGEPETTGIPNRQGFDYWFGYLNQKKAHSYYPKYLWRNQEKYPLPGNAEGQRKQYSHDLMTGEVLSFIERNKSRLFFLYLPYTIPHGDYEVPSDEPYSGRDWPAEWKNRAAMITRMDRDIGKIFKRLRGLGLDNQTVVFFCSDNGPPKNVEFFDSNGLLRGKKQDLYEGGIRVPMIVRWPGKVKAGAVSHQVWVMWDFLPTAAEMVGIKPPGNIDGISMLNVLLGKKQQSHDFLYWEYHGKNGMIQAVRMGDWKAVIKKGSELELYNLKSDLGEKNDVVDRHADVVAKIEDYLKTARTESEYWPTK
jgi:arylsulfatase A-like enzyme